MRIGHFQADSRGGDFDANLAKFGEGLKRADADRVEIVCYPELFLTGVADQEELARAHAFAAQSPQMLKVLDATVRSDHTARAVENSAYFVRGNNYHVGKDPGFTKSDGVGYGDSYIVDPFGEILVRARQFREDFIFADIDPMLAHGKGFRSLWSHRELGKLLDSAGGQGNAGGR